jgi:transposase
LVPIDSSIFVLWGYQPRRGQWVPKGTRPTRPKPVKSQKLHVYAGISKHGKTKLVYATGTTGLGKRYYRAGGKGKYDGVCSREFQDIMELHLYPQAKAIMQHAGQPDPVFLMDGATPHTAEDTIDFLRAKGIEYLHDWPPNSPDLNPIENLWAWLKRQVYADHPRTLAAQIASLEAAWDRVPARMLRKLMRSFNKRLKKCLEREGEHTGY